jgi:hypothetical protein
MFSKRQLNDAVVQIMWLTVGGAMHVEKLCIV